MEVIDIFFSYAKQYREVGVSRLAETVLSIADSTLAASHSTDLTVKIYDSFPEAFCYIPPYFSVDDLN